LYFQLLSTTTKTNITDLLVLSLKQYSKFIAVSICENISHQNKQFQHNLG